MYTMHKQHFYPPSQSRIIKPHPLHKSQRFWLLLPISACLSLSLWLCRCVSKLAKGHEHKKQIIIVTVHAYTHTHTHTHTHTTIMAMLSTVARGEQSITLQHDCYKEPHWIQLCLHAWGYNHFLASILLLDNQTEYTAEWRVAKMKLLFVVYIAFSFLEIANCQEAKVPIQGRLFIMLVSILTQNTCIHLKVLVTMLEISD